MRPHVSCLMTGLAVVAAVGLIGPLFTGSGGQDHEGQIPQHRARPGQNEWNRPGNIPDDWWQEMQRVHGHVGPWNVLGFRIGQAALRELNATWGLHEIEVVCYVPLQTPYTCMVDGVAVGTGNSLGRLDLRLVDGIVPSLIKVVALRKDGQGPVLVFEPRLEYMRSITDLPFERLESVAKAAMKADEQTLFTVKRLPRQ